MIGDQKTITMIHPLLSYLLPQDGNEFLPAQSPRLHQG
jgi:hypothetical protein